MLMNITSSVVAALDKENRGEKTNMLFENLFQFYMAKKYLLLFDLLAPKRQLLIVSDI